MNSFRLGLRHSEQLKTAIVLFNSAVVAALSAGCTGADPESPNIIYILADDLGYGDTGPYGQTRIETPNIDRMAENGMRFTRHYSGSAVSAPSRCVLLTGLHTGHSQVRGNDEWAERGEVWNYRAMLADSTLEGQRPLESSTVTIASLLKANGYATGVVGKWGLGAPHTEGIPDKQGFDFFFGYNCQRQAHTYYPVHLYRNQTRVYTGNDTLAPHTGLTPGADPHDQSEYEKFRLAHYAPDLMFDEMISFIDQNSSNRFFLYWATPVPHLPLQAPERWVEHYVGKFGDEEPYSGGEGYFPVRYPRATYAAMVSYLDEQIGRLIDHLKELGIYENTLIIFSSDNGPAYNAGTDSRWFASAHPFRSERGYIKGSLNEGGIRVPMIALWPGKIKPGTTSEHISAFWDVMPTLCEAAGIDQPDGIDGLSFLPELVGKKQTNHEYLYWEFPEYGGQQAVLIGDMKAIRKGMHSGNAEFELYNIISDPQETHNVADQHPEIIMKVNEIIIKEHNRSSNPRWRFVSLGE